MTSNFLSKVNALNLFLLHKCNMLVRLVIIISISLLAVSCSKKPEKSENPLINKKKRINPNVEERAEAIRDQGGGIFNSSKTKQGTTYEFATSNVLWRASLNTLENIPLNQVDYSGGVVITDWYSVENSNESIKIQIKFLNNELKPSSLKILSFKKICETTNNCKIVKMNNEFNNKILAKVIDKARDLSIKDEEKK